MTFDDVDRACAVLEAAGKLPSGNTVLAHLKARGLPASKRTVLKYLKLRRPAPAAGLTTADDDPVYHGAPAPAPAAAPPPPPATWAAFAAYRQQQERTAAAPAPARDPVQMAEARLDQAREDLLQAKLVLLATQPLPIAGILHGSLHVEDELHCEAPDDVDAAKRVYDEAWAERAAARQHRDQVARARREVHQQAWVAQHRPELVALVEHWEDKLRTAPAERDERHAKKELGQARLAYHQALALAPVDTNGHRPSEEEGAR